MLMMEHLRTRVVFFNDAATTEIYTLSLHDALPIFCAHAAEVIPPKPDRYFNDYAGVVSRGVAERLNTQLAQFEREDRKSTRLNSSHVSISYAVFCLKKKNIATAQYTCRARCLQR